MGKVKTKTQLTTKGCPFWSLNAQKLVKLDYRTGHSWEEFAPFHLGMLGHLEPEDIPAPLAQNHWLIQAPPTNPLFKPRVRIFGRQVYLSTYLFEALYGPLSSNQKLRNICGSGACINPFHMMVVTQKPGIKTLLKQQQQPTLTLAEPSSPPAPQDDTEEIKQLADQIEVLLLDRTITTSPELFQHLTQFGYAPPEIEKALSLISPRASQILKGLVS